MSPEIEFLSRTWDQLEKETDGKAAGICKRIVSQKAIFRIYLGIDCATKAKLFLIEFPKQDTALFDSVTPSKGLLLKVLTKGDFEAECNACAAMSNFTELNSIFTSFAGDVIKVAEQIKDKKHYTINILRRLKLWKAFFENTGGQGLSVDKQIGLFGELDILEKLIAKKGPQVIENWRGPGSAAQDFQFPNAAIEVKSTANEYKTSVTISNMQQLDRENRDKLFLSFNRYQDFQNQGITLPEIVDSIRRQIMDTKWIEFFDDKLLQQGYFIHDATKYKTGYICRGLSFYDVSHSFPKLVRQTIPPEINDVSYTIDLRQCDNYIIDFETICTEI